MSRRLLVGLAFVAVMVAPWSAPKAWAQERTEAAPVDFTPRLVNSVSALGQPGYALEDQVPAPRFPNTSAPKPSPLLASLYASTAILQGLDLHSTFKAFDAGASEANPVMSGLSNHRAAFAATKVAMAVSTILATRHLAKRNKVAAIVSLVAINSVYAMVVRHNYNVARGR